MVFALKPSDSSVESRTSLVVEANDDGAGRQIRRENLALAPLTDQQVSMFISMELLWLANIGNYTVRWRGITDSKVKT